MDRNTGRSRGFGYVEFATVEAANKCLELNGKEIDGRAVRIDKTSAAAPNPEKRAKAFGDTPSEPSSVLFVGNVSFDTTEDGLWEFFAEYGEVKSVRLPTDRDTQRPKGFAYVEFTDIDTAKKAYDGAKGSEIGGRAIRLDFSQPRDGGGGGGGGGNGGGFNRRGRGRGGDNGWVCSILVFLCFFADDILRGAAVASAGATGATEEAGSEVVVVLPVVVEVEAEEAVVVALPAEEVALVPEVPSSSKAQR